MPELAIEGGAPVRATWLPYARHSIADDDIQAAVAVLKSDWVTTGPKIAEFERAFAEFVGAREAVAVSSGTAALHVAMCAIDIGPGDEVVVPAITFAASANCVRYCNGTVVFADVRPDTLTLDPACVEALVTERTRAIVAVDYAGQPCDMDELAAIAERHGLTLVEDACHALGASYRGRRVGTLARMTAFSLHPAKHITTGEGGIVTTDDTELAVRVRLFRNHGISRDDLRQEAIGPWFYEMTELGYNYRLTDFQCALGISQLKKLGEWVTRRRAIASRYTAAFKQLPEVDVPPVLADREPSWHLYVIRLNLERLRVGRTEIFKALWAENIGVQVHYVPVPWHPYYQKLGYPKGAWPVAEAAYERIISVPIFPAMSDEDVEDVIEAVHKVIRWCRR